MTVHCKACGFEWELPMKLPMLIDRAVKAMRGFVAAGCPSCGAFGNAVICGPAPAVDAVPESSCSTPRDKASS
jgi:hypothetical protein